MQQTQPAHMMKRSDLFADVVVCNQFGQEFLFRQDLIRNRAVVINTMFTVCRGSCPGTSETLMRLRRPLSKLLGKRAAILSISIDPEQDHVTRLRHYADQYGAGRAPRADVCDWHFLTGTVEDIERLRRSLGFYDLNEEVDADVNLHAALLLMGNDQANRWCAAPAQARDGLIWEPMRRTLGTTSFERFGIPQPQSSHR